LYITKYPDENLTSNYIFDTKLENRLQDQDQSICEEECSLFTIFSKTFLNAVLEHLKEKLVYNYLDLRDPPF
jgi:hypothetical protein